MNNIELLEQEVSDQVDNMAAEVILALMDKWQAQIDDQAQQAKLKLPELLHHYVRLKIAWSRIKRRIKYKYEHCNFDTYQTQTAYYQNLITEARRNYYVAKREYEGQHPPKCRCRGCQCIGQFSGTSEVAA